MFVAVGFGWWGRWPCRRRCWRRRCVSWFSRRSVGPLASFVVGFPSSPGLSAPGCLGGPPRSSSSVATAFAAVPLATAFLSPCSPVSRRVSLGLVFVGFPVVGFMAPSFSHFHCALRFRGRLHVCWTGCPSHFPSLFGGWPSSFLR